VLLLRVGTFDLRDTRARSLRRWSLYGPNGIGCLLGSLHGGDMKGSHESS
jgi:hypothetical protein